MGADTEPNDQTADALLSALPSTATTVDLGAALPPAEAERYLAAAKEHNANLVGLSALLTTTMPAMKETVRIIKAANLPNICVMIGGAPITQTFADEIGADGYAADAGTAVDVAKKLVGEAA